MKGSSNKTKAGKTRVRCAGKNRDQSDCRGWAQGGAKFCSFHNPSRRLRARILRGRRSGGKTGRVQLLSRDIEEIKDLRDAWKMKNRILRDCYGQKLDPKTASTLLAIIDGIEKNLQAQGGGDSRSDVPRVAIVLPDNRRDPIPAETPLLKGPPPVKELEDQTLAISALSRSDEAPVGEHASDEKVSSEEATEDSGEEIEDPPRGMTQGERDQRPPLSQIAGAELIMAASGRERERRRPPGPFPGAVKGSFRVSGDKE